MSKIEIYHNFIVIKENGKEKCSRLIDNITKFNIYKDVGSTYSLHIYFQNGDCFSPNYPSKKEVEKDFYKIAKIGVITEVKNGK